MRWISISATSGVRLAIRTREPKGMSEYCRWKSGTRADQYCRERRTCWQMGRCWTGSRVAYTNASDLSRRRRSRLLFERGDEDVAPQRRPVESECGHGEEALSVPVYAVEPPCGMRYRYKTVDTALRVDKRPSPLGGWRLRVCGVGVYCYYFLCMAVVVASKRRQGTEYVCENVACQVHGWVAPPPWVCGPSDPWLGSSSGSVRGVGVGLFSKDP